MKIAVLGTGMVGHAIASKLVALGHEVMMGSRTAGNAKASAWAASVGARAQAGTFADSAAFCEVAFNCTRGASSLEALQAADPDNLEGKVVIDVANVLPPADSSGQSLGERIQGAFPLARVVKTLNTVNCEVMVNPRTLPGAHTLFVSGNDAGAKQVARDLLESFGWTDVIDLGDITTARATEGYLPLWLSIWKQLKTAGFNIHVVR